MREINFRVWLKAKNEMAYDFYGIKFQQIKNIHPVNSVSIWDDGEVSYDRAQVELMQFTGLKDKNGKDIYEGDILKDKIGCIWRVKFLMGKFNIFCNTEDLIKSVDYDKTHKRTEEEQDAEDLDAWWYNKEIVGNVHENPELLECKK